MKARSDRPYIGKPEFAAARRRGESGCSVKGEKEEKGGLVNGLNPRGALTAIIAAEVNGLRHDRSAPNGQVDSASSFGAIEVAEGRRTGGRERDRRGRLLPSAARLPDVW